MAEAYFEYTDSKGSTHRVDSISDVPKKYIRTMVAVGAEKTEETAEDGGSGAPFAMPELNYTNMTPVLLGVVFLRSKNFTMKCMTGAALVIWLLFMGWQWFETSPYARTAEKKSKNIPPEVQKRLPQTFKPAELQPPALND